MEKKAKVLLKELADKHKQQGAVFLTFDISNSGDDKKGKLPFEYLCTFTYYSTGKIFEDTGKGTSKKVAEEAACEKVWGSLQMYKNQEILLCGTTSAGIILSNIKEVRQPEAIKVSKKIAYYPTVLLGKGATANVFEGYFEISTRKAAVKICMKDVVYSDKSKELAIMRKISHPNIVTYFITEDVGINTYIVMELGSNTLENIIKNNSSNTIISLKKWTKDMTTGLAKLHEHKIVHRDLKPSNVLIFENNNVAKLADFGISKELDSNTMGVNTEANRGTRPYMPPEAITAIGSTNFVLLPSFDVFALGLTIFFTMTGGKHMFHLHADKSREFNIQNNIIENKANWELVNDIEYTSLKNLLEVLVHKNPKCRPDSSVIIEHPFFWDDKKSIDFILAVNNDFKNTSSAECTTEMVQMHTRFVNATGTNNNWKSRLSSHLQEFIDLRSSKKDSKKYNEKSFKKMIEFIRDHYNHYEEWNKFDDNILRKDEIFGKDGSQYGPYFLKIFPELTTVLYTFFQKEKYRGLHLQDYYEVNKSECFPFW